jgi:hypothetical protein
MPDPKKKKAASGKDGPISFAGLKSEDFAPIPKGEMGRSIRKSVTHSGPKK